MGQCSKCGHDHERKFCPECGSSSSSVDGSSQTVQSDEPSTQAEVPSNGVPVSDKADGYEENDEAKESTPKVRSRSGPRVVRVTQKKESVASSKSVSTRKIVKKPLPSSTGKAKTPGVRTRVVANIEKKQAREENDKKKPSGNSMKDKISHASGWRWM